MKTFACRNVDCGRRVRVEVLPKTGPNVPAGTPEFELYACPVCQSPLIEEEKPDRVLEEAVRRGHFQR